MENENDIYQSGFIYGAGYYWAKVGSEGGRFWLQDCDGSHEGAKYAMHVWLGRALMMRYLATKDVRFRDAADRIASTLSR